MKILLVEDDEGLLAMLRQVLASQHYLVECATDGLVGWELAETFDYDLILLDWTLPRLDGISFCQRLRAQVNVNAPVHSSHPNCNTPVILLTARDSSDEQVLALDAGADDYLVKPISPVELLARIRALLRRGSGSRSPVLVWGNLCLSPESCEVTCQDQTIPLTATEYGVLELLTRHPQRIFSQAYLLERLWQAKEMPTENTVRSHIKALRQKLKKAGAGDVIETVYGLGYRLKEVIEEQGAAIGSLESKELGEVGEEIQTPNPQSLTSNSLPQNLVTIWEKHRGQYAERLQVILDAIAQLATGDLNPDLQLRAGREAHTLVGSLGSFNLHQMAQLAGVLEQHFKSPSLSSTQASSLSELATILSQLIHHGLVESKTEQIVQNSKQTLQHSKQSIQKSAAGIHSTKEPFPTIQVLIVENDLTLATAIETEAIRWGIQVEIAPTPAVARTLVSKSWPDVILLDLTTSETEWGGLELLKEWSNNYPQMPVIVFAAQAGLEERLAVVQAGARMSLQKPIAPQEVVQAIAQVVQSVEPSMPSLLIVDDDPAMLVYLQSLLLPWGFQVTLLSEPQQFWTVLEQIQPDLLVLDIEMPDISGLDLCQIVRNDAQWGELPILMLSVYRNAETLTQVFNSGADDYINKPVTGPELIARIANRLRRSGRRSC